MLMWHEVGEMDFTSDYSFGSAVILFETLLLTFSVAFWILFRWAILRSISSMHLDLGEPIPL